MKRVKSYLRNNMGQARLNHLMTLNIYNNEAAKLNLAAVANEFVSGHENRLRIFGTFSE